MLKLKIILPHLAPSIALAGSMIIMEAIITNFMTGIFVGLVILCLYYWGWYLHEIGHYLLSRHFQAAPMIDFSRVVSSPGSHWDAIWISLAGPLVGFLFYVATGVLLGWLSFPVSALLGVTVLAINHIAMLLPSFPDGKIIANAIQRRMPDEKVN